MNFENIKSNDIFDLLIDSYKKSEGFGDEPMDGDDTERMANIYSTERGWGEIEKRKFLNYANIREGNTNPQDFDINLNEMENNIKKELKQKFHAYINKYYQAYTANVGKDLEEHFSQKLFDAFELYKEKFDEIHPLYFEFNQNMNEMENKEKNRMRKLTQSFEQKNEIFKEERERTNSEKINEEYKRLSELASGKKTNAKIEEAQQVGVAGRSDQTGGFHGTNQPRSVTSIIDNLYSNPSMYQGAQGNSSIIKDNEAMELSIKRTLNSGAPVNNIAFYDEVNWNLAQLGFPSKLPQDIKTVILKLIN